MNGGRLSWLFNIHADANQRLLYRWLGDWHSLERESQGKCDEVLHSVSRNGIDVRLSAWAVPLLHRMERVGLRHSVVGVFKHRVDIRREMHHGVQGNTMAIRREGDIRQQHEHRAGHRLHCRIRDGTHITAATQVVALDLVIVLRDRRRRVANDIHEEQETTHE